MNSYPLLDKIDYPSDLKKLTKDQLVELCAELRRFVIEVISRHPGHFAAALGVVELTVALHYVYNAPYDEIVFDVGHQAYIHKILTGRKQMFDTLRTFHGLSPFPNRDESPYDAFTVGHASTSISSALGLAVASKILKQEDRHIISVIGDGAMTGGMAYEALNNAGIQKSNLLVILNDNHIAIDPNQGALNDYLLDITTSKTYNRVRNDVWNILGKFNRLVPSTRDFLVKVEKGIKYVVMKRSNLFSGFGFRYFGPVDGHDVVHLSELLSEMKNIKGPKLLHVITKKGKGYKFAEENQTAWHATSSAFNIETGEVIEKEGNKKVSGEKFQTVFGKTLTELAEKNPHIVGVTPAMPSGCSMNIMAQKFPDRVFDVGIAEEHAVTFSAGMAAQGLIPFCNIYSTFMQRSYDQIIHDVCLPRLPVILCLDRAGLVGADGATHQGAFDISYLRHIPNLVVSAPFDEADLRNLMYTAMLTKRPFSIRYPRGYGHNPDWQNCFQEMEIGKGRLLTEGEDVAVVSIGTAGYEVLCALEMLKEENIFPAHYDMRFVKPLDTELLDLVFKRFSKIITVEDGALQGGFGSAVAEYAADKFYTAKIKRLGIPDRFIEHGSQQDLYELCGYDRKAIAKAVKEMIKM